MLGITRYVRVIAIHTDVKGIELEFLAFRLIWGVQNLNQ